MNNYLITWFYAENKNNESYYPSVGGNTSSFEFQKVYWRCIYVFYKTAIITNKDIKYMFFTNTDEIPKNIDGVDISNFFIENNIEVIKINLSTITCSDWFGAWRNQFYVFDILRYLNDNKEGNFLILDSDVFIRDSLNDVFLEIQKHQSIQYNCLLNRDEDVDGLNQEQLKKLYKQFYYEEPNDELVYWGGELIAVTSKIIPKILDEFDYLWKENYKNYLSGKYKLNEEAHFLSIIYYKLKIYNSIANRYIRRMWTAYRYDDLRNDDLNLIMWHIPSEKKYAFKKAYKKLSKNALDKQEMNNYISKLILIKYPKFVRKAKRMLNLGKEKIKKSQL